MSPPVPETGRWNFGDLFDALAPALGNKPALIHGDVVVSWAEFGTRSNRLARALVNRGLKPNDKVAFFLRNSPAYLELFAACVKARLVHVNVNYRYVETELLHVLTAFDVRAVVFDDEFDDQISSMRDRLAADTLYVAVGPRSVSQESAAGGEGNEVPRGIESFERLCTEGDSSALPLERSGDDLYFQCTGGTTGMPKAVMWRQHDRIALFGMAQGTDAAGHASLTGARENSSILLPACPLMHSTALTTALVALCGGGTVVTLVDPRFNAEELLETVQRRNVSTLSIVGDAFSRPILEVLRKQPSGFNLDSVTSISSAGVMWSSECKTELHTYFGQAVLRDSLGSSEGSGLASMETRVGSSSETGRFLIGDNVKVFTDDFREVTPGSSELGRIAKSGFIPVGYYRDEVKTAETFPVIKGIRYSIPGDWCSVETDGTIRLFGRGSNCINTGGEKVFPEEVEVALCRLEGVVDALVVGVPDEGWGEAIAAVVQCHSPGGHDVPDAESLRVQLRSVLAGYKIPKHIRFVDEVPRAANGKAEYRRVLESFVLG